MESYLSIKVDDVINQLDLVFQRTGKDAASGGKDTFNEALNIYVFCLVSKFVEWKNGRLFTGYAKPK